jgi:hypothetical protein
MIWSQCVKHVPESDNETMIDLFKLYLHYIRSSAGLRPAVLRAAPCGRPSSAHDRTHLP